MGCDYSKRTKQGFDTQVREMNSSIKTIKKHQKALNSSISNLKLPKEPIETLDELRSSLVPYLQKIESLLLEIKNIKESNDGNDKKTILDSQKKLKQQSTKAESYDIECRGDSPTSKKERDTLNILEDPAIKAMIEKNRKKFSEKKK
jgi:hypothetical protein